MKIDKPVYDREGNRIDHKCVAGNWNQKEYCRFCKVCGRKMS